MKVSTPWTLLFFVLLSLCAPVFGQNGCTGPLAQLSASYFDASIPTPVLRETILKQTANEADRASLAAFSLARMKAAAPQTVGKKKVIFIGAGIHGVTALSNLVQRDPKIAAQVLMLEAGEVCSANFGQGQPFHINSGIPDFVGKAHPNEMPGAVVSPEDFGYNADGTNAYPNPKVFSDAATISLAAQNVDVLFGARVTSVVENTTPSASSRYTVLTADGRKFEADAIVMGMGVSAPKLEVKGLQTIYAEEKTAALPRVQVYTDFLKDMGAKGRASFEELRGKTIGVIGAQHGGNITVEALLGKVPEAKGDVLASKIVWWGQKARDAKQFIEIQRPGGGDKPRDLFKLRYSLYGIPEAFESKLIEPVAEKAVEVRRLPTGRFLIVSSGPNGPPEEREVDYLFLAQGFETPSLGILRASFPTPDHHVDLTPVEVAVEGAPEAVASQVKTPDGREQTIFLIGPGSKFPIDPGRTDRSVTGSPESINVLAPLSAGFGKWLRGVVGLN